MMHDYGFFLYLKELRRQIEARLPKYTLLFFHCAVFVSIAAIVTAQRAYWFTPNYYYGYFAPPQLGMVMAIWSAALLFHGSRVYLRSGFRAEVRGRVIEDVLQHGMKNDQPMDVVARTHRLLDTDVRLRNGSVGVLGMFTLINAVMWILWAIGARALDSFAWQMTIGLGFVFVILLGFGEWRRAQQERWLSRQMLYDDGTRKEKPKNASEVPSSI